MRQQLLKYKAEAAEELKAILDYWITHTPDENGGFIGRIVYGNKKHPDAPKGSVLNSRILWAFSAAFNLTKNVAYLQIAHLAFGCLQKYFIDKTYGGVYWTVTTNGEPLDTKKQIYALAFAVYGLSEYHKASGDEVARQAAIDLYNDIITHSYDKTYGGYLEALSRDWKEMDDLRLSEKDANERKSMNTHLHLLEGFAALYFIWPNGQLEAKLAELVHLFISRISSKNTYHLNLFFEDDWIPKSTLISYGHDVEAAWLVQEAAELLGGKLHLPEVKSWSLQVARAAARGLDNDGGLWYEYDSASKHLVRQKHSWPQAEAMVGFFNAWQNTGDEKWLCRSIDSWNFVQRFIKDKTYGEWHWGVNEDYSPMDQEDKVGIWKCPYHNSRACIEIIHRINRLID